MIILTLLESEEQIISGIPEYIEFETDVASNVFYTLDGTEPTIESLIALGKVYLPTSGLTLTLKAIALSASDSSGVLEQTYSSDSTALDGPRNIGEGVSVLPFGSTSVNNLSFDADGYAAQESSIEFVDLDIKASLIPNSKKTSISFVNFAEAPADDDSFSSSSVNDNVYFDPKAKLILVDGSTDELFDNQQVKLINRTYNSFDPTSRLYTERLGQEEPIITGNYVRSYYNAATKEYVSFYYESVDSRWIISKQKLENTVVKSGHPSGGPRGGRFVYRWVESPGLSTPTASVGSVLTKAIPEQSAAPQALPDNWIIVTEYPEGTILYNGSEVFPEIEAGETYRFVYDESLEPDDAIGFTYDGLTPYEDGITREGDPGDDGAYFEWEVAPDISVPPYGSELYVYIGGDPYIGDELTVTGSTFTSTPSEPTIDSITEGDGQVSVSITPGDDGGSEITDYEYTIDGGNTWTSIGSTASPLVISPLVNGVEYDIQIRPVNDNGSGESSAVFSATPSTVPEQPTITSIVTGDQELTVSVTGGSGGSAITDYEYSLNGGAFISAGTAISPFAISGLTNGVAYDVVVQAVNANGTGTPSAATTATPSTVPAQPTIDSITAGDEELTVAFTAGDDGGSALTDIEYTLDGTNWVSAGTTTSPFTITGLTNGVTYPVQIRPVNANGTGTPSTVTNATPEGAPATAPTIDSFSTGDGTVTINFTPGDDGGSAITDYEYTLDGGLNYISAGTTVSPVVVSGLTNGTEYNIEIRPVNANGAGPDSTTVTATPSTIPDAPTLVSLTPGDAQLSVDFTLNGDGGSAITDVEYRINGTGSWFSAGTTSSPFVIGSLVNGVSYSVEVRAVNSNGASSASNSITSSPTSSWSPTDVTPAAWFDASDTSSYSVSGSNVTGVTDKAGNATVTVNGTPNITNLLDGKNVWKFESNNNEDFTTDEFAQVDASGNHWAIGLMQWNTRNDPQDSFWSTENNTVSSGSKRDYAISAGASAFDGELDLDALSSPNKISSVIGNKQDFDSGIAQNTWVILCAIFNKTGNQIAVRVNGTNAFTPVNDYDNSLNTNMDLRIFRNRANERMGGMMAEFLVVANVPGTGGTDITDVEKAEGYLAHKWGLEGQLPPGHPYKSSPP